MIPFAFDEANVVLGKDQPEYQPLPARIGDDGVVTTCWDLNDLDVARIVRDRKIWLQQMTFGAPFQPQLPSTQKPGAQ